MKIGILTFHTAINYGALFQAYGLKEVLQSLGNEVAIIDYRPNYITEAYRPWSNHPSRKSLITVSGWKNWIQYVKTELRRSHRKKKFEKFLDEHFELYEFEPHHNLSHGQFDYIICGSDQIWNPKITGGKLDNVFWGNSIKSGKQKLIAYAASAGSVRNLVGYENNLLSSLKNFYKLSVREQQLSDYFKSQYPSLKSTVVVDPVFLATRKVFEPICKNRILKQTYLLYFDLSNNTEFRKNAKKIARSKNLLFKELTTYHEFVPGQKILPPASPEEFCTLFRDADFVCCSSFHGTLFSILFEKDFILYCHPDHGYDRMSSVLSKIGLSERLFSDPNLSESMMHLSKKAIDYPTVNTAIDILRKESLAWIKDAIDSSI